MMKTDYKANWLKVVDIIALNAQNQLQQTMINLEIFRFFCRLYKFVM